jgi:hypothetical protein
MGSGIASGDSGEDELTGGADSDLLTLGERRRRRPRRFRRRRDRRRLLRKRDALRRRRQRFPGRRWQRRNGLWRSRAGRPFGSFVQASLLDGGDDDDLVFLGPAGGEARRGSGNDAVAGSNRSDTSPAATEATSSSPSATTIGSRATRDATG